MGATITPPFRPGGQGSNPTAHDWAFPGQAWGQPHRPGGAMKPTVLVAVCAAASLFLAGAADAATTTSSFQGSLSPTKAGTKKAPKNVTLKANATIQTDDGSQPPQATSILVGMDRNIVVNSKDFVVKGCTVAQLNNSKDIDDP